MIASRSRFDASGSGQRKNDECQQNDHYQNGLFQHGVPWLTLRPGVGDSWQRVITGRCIV
jgi:hypothetical protein